MTPVLIAVIIIGASFDLLNGIHDSSNVVATMISSRAFHLGSRWGLLPWRSFQDHSSLEWPWHRLLVMESLIPI